MMNTLVIYTEELREQAFQKGGTATFLVESTFQLMCAREAIYEFEIEDYHIVMTTFKSDGPRNQQMIEAAKKWGFQMEQIDMASVDFDAFFVSGSSLNGNRKRYDRVFIGDSRCLNMLVIAADYARKGGVIVALDDGNATIGELKKIYHISKPLSDWVQQYHWWQGKNAYIRKRQNIIQTLTEKGIIYTNAFFTVFDDIESDDFHIHRNSFTYLLSHQQVKNDVGVGVGVGVVIIGTPMESIARMYYADLEYVMNIFKEQLQSIKSQYLDETIVYIPHPRDINQRDKELCERFGVKYQTLTEPVESYILSHADYIKAVYGYGSTALIVLRKILPQVHIVNIEFTYGKSVEKEILRETLNEYYRQSGMTIKHIVMPLSYVKSHKNNFLTNCLNLFGVLKRRIQKSL